MQQPEEILDIVDNNDKVIGKTTKKEKFDKGHITRNAAVFLKNSEGKLLIVKRAPNKKSFPNMYDISACGHVMSGETPEQTAIRELDEELGIKQTKPELIINFYQEQKEHFGQVRFFSSYFTANYDGDIKPNDEFSEVKWLTLEELNNEIQTNQEKFCPFFVTAFNKVKNLL